MRPTAEFAAFRTTQLCFPAFAMSKKPIAVIGFTKGQAQFYKFCVVDDYYCVFVLLLLSTFFSEIIVDSLSKRMQLFRSVTQYSPQDPLLILSVIQNAVFLDRTEEGTLGPFSTIVPDPSKPIIVGKGLRTP